MTAGAAVVPDSTPRAVTARARRLGIDTGQEAVAYFREDSPVVHSEGFESATRVWVRCRGKATLATVNVVSALLAPDEVGLSESSWRRLDAVNGARLEFAHAEPLESIRHVRAKAFGVRLDTDAIRAIVHDIAAGLYSDIHLAAFVTACAGRRLDRPEIADLTVAMLEAGNRLHWDGRLVADKHCVGGLPGNRTSLIVVPIAAAAGLIVPKTSSRAITSPAGTADTMETLAPVELDVAAMRSVVDREGACIVWGGRAGLSPADDALIRVERPLELDAVGQLVASILSKKAAAGVTHVLIDIPVGPTAKVRSPAEAERLSADLRAVGRVVQLEVVPVTTDGTQPVGRGIGPALEARDVLAVLQNRPEAPPDLRERAVELAGGLCELGGVALPSQGQALAAEILADGRAWRKFQAVCEAQGGMRRPPSAAYTRAITARCAGRVSAIDNRRLARLARLAGAPHDPGAGLELHVRLGQRVTIGEPLLTLHAAARGELDYAVNYAGSAREIIKLEREP
ncbi:MAG TPA: thymidine phosphorylase family protein [Gemmatimonadales bacterium]|nr:thymidine phosphorylase family protein [Gemmatimonadales bacterium]